jgi:hypothetical protein
MHEKKEGGKKAHTEPTINVRGTAKARLTQQSQ